MKRVVKVRVNSTQKVIKHVFLGAMFGVLNEISFRIFGEKKTNDQLQGLFPIDIDPNEIESIVYKKEDLFNKMEGLYHINKHESRKTEFLKNFLYGSLIVYLGNGVGNYAINSLKNASFLKQIIFTIPLEILPYYVFCSFFDGKTTNEFLEKLKLDFLPLAFGKFCLNAANFSYAKKLKSLALKNSKSFPTGMRKAALLLIASNLIWVFLITSFYHNRISFQSGFLNNNTNQNDSE